MKKALLGTGRLIGDTKNPSAVKKITTGIKGVDFDEQETGDSLASLAVSKSAESPASKSKGSAGAGAVPEKGNLRQYPLHTKRGRLPFKSPMRTLTDCWGVFVGSRQCRYVLAVFPQQLK